MAKKILGVDNLDVIRDFVLSKVMSESDDIKRVLTEENAAYLQKKLLEAAESLKNDYESKYDNLYDQLEKLKQDGADIEAIKELELRIDALNNNYIDQHNSLKRIEDSIADIGDSVMSPGQLNELINTALIEKTTITDDMIETPNLYTKNLVALIAKFGTVRALNIIGDEIEGKTISAYDKIPGTNDPTWKLKRDGDGYLAGKNIVWDKNGNVTFGDKVKIKWGSVTDTPDDFGSGTSVFTSTVFKRTNTKPSKPTGGSFSNPLPDDTTWTDGIPDGSEILWAATRVFASDGGHRQQTEWVGPSQMTDTETLDVEFSSVAVNPGNPTDNPNNWKNEGDSNTIWMATATITNGVKSAWTITKIKGEDGTDGTDGVGVFKSTVFKRTNTILTAADKPVGGSFSNPVPTGWSDGIPAGEEILWASTATFSSDGSKDVDWSTPAQMTDTHDFEIIYSSKETPAAPGGNFAKDADGEITEWLKSNPDWTDDGVESSIWMATIKAANGVWGDWSVTKIKGEKGEDGVNGVDGIDGKDGTSISVAGYFDTEEELWAAFPNGPDPVTNAYVVNGDLYVWASGSWKNVGKFTGNDGVSTFKSTVFKRTNSTPSKPTGGSYASPTPQGWSDGIPAGEEILWASTATFSSDGSKDVDWTTPAQMTDTHDFEVIYSGTDFASKSKALASIPAGFKKNGVDIDADWLSKATNWTDDGEDGSIWMATIKSSNGVWGSWTVSKIKGESGKDGEDGEDGTDGAQVYLHIKYAESVSFDMSGNVSQVALTGNNGEDRGPWQGMYSDYTEADSNDVKKYKWFQIDAEKAVETEFGKYNITSNTIVGKTMYSTTSLPLANGTEYLTFDADGLETGKVTSDGTKSGPAWQIKNHGDGYLAAGNIRWDSSGNLLVNGKINGNIASESGDTVGPWKVSKIANTTYIHDGNTQAGSNTFFGSDNSFRMGGALGIRGSNTGGISIGNTSGGKGITVGTDGTVKFGDNVSLKWGNVTDKPDDLGGLTETDVTNIIGTTITKDYIESKQVRATDIIGDTLTGKTIKSSGDNWFIGKDGDGKLAKGNITWDTNGNVTLGENVKLSWGTIQGRYRLICNVPYFRTIVDKTDGTLRLDYKNENHDTTLGEKIGYYWTDSTKTTKITDKTSAAYHGNYHLFTLSIFEYNEATNDWDTPVTSQMKLIDEYSFTDKANEIGNTISYGGGNSYYQVKYDWGAASTSNPYKQSHRLYPNPNKIKIWIEGYPNCYVEIPVIEADEEWRGESGLTEADVTKIIGTTITKDYIESKKICATTIEAGALTAHEATIKNLAASQITADKINALDITAKDISATTLTGKTIKSTDGNWEINNAGTFKLGGSNGINKSSATGGIQFGTSANGFNLDANGKLTFGSNVKLAWGNVSNQPTIPTESSITTIANNAITTANLDASKITTGTLSAARLDVDNLSVKKLNTTGSSTGARVAVEGNNINIYNSSSKVSCTITNSSMGNLDIYDVLQGGTGGTIDYSVSPSVNMYVPTTSYSGQQTINWSCGGKQSLGYFQNGGTIKIGGNWSITNMSHPAGSITLQPKLTIKLYGNDTVQKTYEGSSGTSGISPTSANSFSSTINETTFTVPFAGTWAYEATITGWWQPGSSLVGTGNVSYDSSLVSITGSYSSYDSSIKTSSRIYDDGAIFQNTKGGFAINNDAVAMKCGSSQIVMKDGNIYMAFAGSATPKQIVPRTFKFRLDGNKNQTMTVLTFGDILDE